MFYCLRPITITGTKLRTKFIDFIQIFMLDLHESMRFFDFFVDFLLLLNLCRFKPGNLTGTSSQIN